MDDGSLLRGEEERAAAWREVVLHRTEKRATAERSLPLWALLLAVAVHIAIFVALRTEIVRRAAVESTAISVQMIDLIPAAPPISDIPPEPIPPPITHPTQHVARPPTPVSEPPLVTVLAAPPDPTAPTLHLNNADGSLALPSPAAARSHANVARVLDAPPGAATSVMRLPWGTRVQCAWIVIIAGCAWGPPDDYWHGDQSWKPATELDEK